MQKTSKKYEHYAKTQIIEAIKFISYYRNIIYFCFNFIYTNSAKIILKE